MTAAAAAAPKDGVPRKPIWTEHFTESGRPFWYNRQTKQRTWKRPPEAAAASSCVPLPPTTTSPADGIDGAGRRVSSTSGSESGATSAASARSPPTSSAFSDRKSLFDADQRKPRASKLALYAYYAASLEDGERPPLAKGSSKGDADSDSGRPPSESGDTGASGGKNGFILDDEGFWTRTDDIEAEYGAAEQLTPVTFKQKFVIRDAPVDALATAAGSDPQLLRQATMGLGLPPALPAGSRRRSSSASSSSSSVASVAAPVVAAKAVAAAPALPLAGSVTAAMRHAPCATAGHRKALPPRSQGKERELAPPAAPVVEEAEEEEEDWL